MLKKVLLGLLVILILIQLIPANLPEVSDTNPDDILLNNEVPEEIATILKTSCYDCHSNETVYPWYSYVVPVSFLVSRDTEVGRKHINFSEWQSMSKADKAEALDESAEEVDEGNMPMPIYPLTHPNARLSANKRKAFVAWAEEFAEALYE
ncbi:MAG: heme-binding domain-containing protein [Bacteroidota bacterium]